MKIPIVRGYRQKRLEPLEPDPWTLRSHPLVHNWYTNPTISILFLTVSHIVRPWLTSLVIVLLAPTAQTQRQTGQQNLAEQAQLKNTARKVGPTPNNPQGGQEMPPIPSQPPSVRSLLASSGSEASRSVLVAKFQPRTHRHIQTKLGIFLGAKGMPDVTNTPSARRPRGLTGKRCDTSTRGTGVEGRRGM